MATDPKIQIVADVLKLVGVLLETHKPEDVRAVLEQLRDHGVKPITGADLDAIDEDVRNRHVPR